MPPIDPHDLAKWLLVTLEDQNRVGEAGVTGRLPAAVDWEAIEEAEQKFKNLFGYNNRASRKVEFYPESVQVFESLERMLRVVQHQRKFPGRFSLLQENFDSASDLEPPPEVVHYLLAVKLASALTKAADAAEASGERLLFIKGHRARIKVKLTYMLGELLDVPGLDAWVRDFVDADLHQEQKQTLLRQALLDLFKDQAEVTLGALLPRFPELDAAMRAAYAMYMAEFTFERVKAEVEKDNLDSSIKIGKAVSDIQNQLLAMPVALLLAGGQMTPGVSVKNIVLLLGAVAFAWLMRLLIGNQRATLFSIEVEVASREAKLAKLPPEVADRLQSSFKDLSDRVAVQNKTLGRLETMVALGLLCTVGAFCWFAFRA